MSDHYAEMRVHALESAHYPELTDMMIAALQAAYPDANAERWRGACVDTLIESREHNIAWTVIFDGTGTMIAAFSDNIGAGPSCFIVAPDRWGSKLSDKILAIAHKAATGALAITISDDNQRAQRFFTRHGFRKSDRAVCAVTGKSGHLWRGAR